jgi:hypothetical protein
VPNDLVFVVEQYDAIGHPAEYLIVLYETSQMLQAHHVIARYIDPIVGIAPKVRQSTNVTGDSNDLKVVVKILAKRIVSPFEIANQQDFWLAGQTLAFSPVDRDGTYLLISQ